jgi:hypothetical protein
METPIDGDRLYAVLDAMQTVPVGTRTEFDIDHLECDMDSVVDNLREYERSYPGKRRIHVDYVRVESGRAGMECVLVMFIAL